MGIELWLRHRFVRRENRRWHDYTIHAPDGEVRFTASAARVPGPITVWSADTTAHEIVRGRPRRSFPLTGRYDVIAPPDTRLGVITRLGRIYDAAGARVGRYRDARSLKEHVGEGVLTLVMESLIAGDAAAGNPGGPYGYVLVRDGHAPGRLARARLPFEATETPAREPGRVAGALRRVLPRRASEAIFQRGETHGWVLDVPDAGGIAEPLLLTSALLAIEIALW